MNKKDLYYLEGVKYLYPRYEGAYGKHIEMDRNFKYIAVKTSEDKEETELKVLYSIHDGKVYDVSKSNLVLNGHEYDRIYLKATKKPNDMSTEDFINKVTYFKDNKRKSM